jgi:hypothetical protein
VPAPITAFDSGVIPSDILKEVCISLVMMNITCNLTLTQYRLVCKGSQFDLVTETRTLDYLYLLA